MRQGSGAMDQKSKRHKVGYLTTKNTKEYNKSRISDIGHRSTIFEFRNSVF